MATKESTLAKFDFARAEVDALNVIVPPNEDPDALFVASVVTRIADRPRCIIMGARMPSLQGHTLFIGASDGNRYMRSQHVLELWDDLQLPPTAGTYPKGTAVIRGIIENTVTSTTPQLTFGSAWNAVVTLTPRVGAPIQLPPVAVAANASFFDVVVVVSTIPEVDGGYLMSVAGFPAGWSVMDMPLNVRRGAVIGVPQTWVLTTSGSYEHEQRKMDGQHHWSYAWVPAGYDPITIPLPLRTYPPVGPVKTVEAPAGSTTQEASAWRASLVNEMQKFAYTMVIPFKEDDIHDYNQLPTGVGTRANIQNYGFNGFYERAEPMWAIRQGKRGEATLVSPTSLVMTARQDTPAKVSVVMPHCIGTVGEDATVHINWGAYHDNNPSPYTNWDATKQQRAKPIKRFAGSWAASVPVARQVFQEGWDMATDMVTTAVDENAAPIGNPPQKPHLIDVVQYVTETAALRADPKNPSFGGRLLKITYGKAALAREGIAEEFINFPINTKPWGCVIVGRLIIVTLVGPKLVNAYNLDTKELVWSVQMPMAPYGIRVLDGIALIGCFEKSPLAGAAYKLDLATQTFSKAYDLLVNGNSFFANVAWDDGTFVERGGSAYVTWSNNTYGWPVYMNAAGKRLAIGARNNSWGEPKGMFCPGGISYASAVAIGNGQMVWGSVQDGLHRLSKALPTDAVVPAACMLGYQELFNMDAQLTHGYFGWGDKKMKQMFGISTNIDALLTNMGHTP